MHQINGGRLTPLGEVVHHLVGEVGDVVLRHLGEMVLEHFHHAWGEVTRDQTAMLPVLRRIHIDEVGRVSRVAAGEVHLQVAATLRCAELAGGVETQHLSVREQLRVRTDEADVGVLGDRPERLVVRSLVPVDRRFPTKQVPFRPGVTLVAVAVRVGDVDGVKRQCGRFSSNHVNPSQSC